MTSLLCKLKALKLCLRNWNASVFGNIHDHDRVSKAKENLAMIQNRITEQGFSDSLQQAEADAKQEVLLAVRNQHLFYQEKACIY